MPDKTLATTEAVATPVQNGNGADGTREERRYLVPPVDIHETKEGLIVTADLPGVDKDGLEVRVENGVLTILGRVTQPADIPGAFYREFQLNDYFRQFKLHEEVDVQKINAELKHGVLTIRLPHAEAAKPRQIEVKIT